MADVITRFKLETAQYDSKLRDAAKGLQAYGKQIETAGKDFTNFSQKAVEAARSLGTIASGANNTKDKLKDLVGAYNDVAKTYNKLTDQQRQTDFGKNMAASLEQLQVRIKETKQELYGLGDATKNTGGGLFGGGKLDGMLQVFGGNVMTKVAGMALGAVTSLTSEMEDAVKQGIELAKQGEGIRIAFERLGQDDILDGLRQATHGTVTDIELMKAAVKFNDFNLPVEELGTMLAFAQQKAKDTGQSVDYMVDSIVTGLGRKSLMILDNLGLSAAEVKEKMAETGDMTEAVGAIIREQMSEAGDYVETAADRAAQANVSLQNKMEELGCKFAPVEEASSQLWTSMKIGILDVIGGPLATLLNQLTEAGRLKDQLNNMNGGGMMERFENNLRNSKDPSTLYSRQLAAINRSINAAEAKLQQAEKGGMGSIQIYRERVQALKEVKKQYEGLYKTITSPAKNPLIASDTDKKKTKKGGGNTKTVKTEEQLNNDKIQKLTQEYIKASDDRRKAIEGEIKTLQDRNAEIERLKDEALGKYKPIGKMDQAQGVSFGEMMQSREAEELQNVAIKLKTPLEILQEQLENMTQFRDMAMSGEQWRNRNQLVESKQSEIDAYMGKSKEIDNESIKKIGDKLQGFSGGLASLTGGLKQIGIEIPREVDQVIGVIQGLSTIIQGVQSVIQIFSTTSQTANTVALTANTAALWAVAATNAIPFARGGIVPKFAGGGLIGKAAGGMLIPGNSFSGDNLRLPVDGGRGVIGVNSGELILSKAQQSTLASQLSNDNRGMNIVGEIQGEKIVLAANRFFKRTGQGEIVTWG